VHELVYVFSFLVDRILVSCIRVRLCVDIKSKNLKTFLKALVLSNLKNALSLFLGRRRISKGSPFQVEGPTIENARRCLVAVEAWCTDNWPVTEERRVRRPGRPDTQR